VDTALRIERERAFWDTTSAPDYYADWQEATYETWHEWPIRRAAAAYLGPLRGKKLLLCGEGEEAVYFAREGAEVWCFDISAVRIQALQDLVNRRGVADRVHLSVQPFEHLDYPDDFFDLAFGQAIVHHVDLTLGGRELNRVLKPGGRASFIEPLGTNPLLAFARARLPYRHKDRTEDEEPVDYADIRAFGASFARLTYREFKLLGMLRRRVIQNRTVCDVLDKLDTMLLTLPPLRRFCMQVWIGVEAGPHRP
jgi:SAM-dependent methyltransferase